MPNITTDRAITYTNFFDGLVKSIVLILPMTKIDIPQPLPPLAWPALWMCYLQSHYLFILLLLLRGTLSGVLCIHRSLGTV